MSKAQKNTDDETKQAKAEAEAYTPNEALVRAISECENATARRINPHFKSRYFGLSDLLDIVKPTFAKYGLCIIQTPKTQDGILSVTANIYHKSGQIWNMESMGVKAESINLHAIGSALSYLRRYQLATICGVAAELDDQDDGNIGSRAQANSQGNYPKKIEQQRATVSTTWISELGLDDPAKSAVAQDILQKKGWLTQGQSLAHLSPDNVALLITPKMRQAFLKAVTEAIPTPEL
jgi:hypothetical protein